MNKIYDLVIIGGGPAGLSAALYAGRAKINTLIIEKDEIGGQVNKTYEISNYPGAKGTNGPKLMAEMREQVEEFGVEFMGAEVTSVDFESDKDLKVLSTNNGDVKARSVIIATGATPRKIGFKGEEEFTGRGIGYCATCDGEFFDGLEVFVIGGGFAAAEEAVFLTRYATKVTVVSKYAEFKCSKSIADMALNNPKIEVMFNTEIVEAGGEGLVNYAKFINNQTGETFVYNAKKEDGSFGIFVFVGYSPKSDLFKDILELDERGYIITNENMETKIPGVYVAGDLRPKELRQIVTAVSDGAIAATVAEKYVCELKTRLGIKDEPVDLIQIARVTALNSIDKYNFEGKSSFTAYLDGAIRNNFNNMLRNTMRKSYESSLDAPIADGMFASDFICDDNLTEEIVEKEFMLKELLTALEELSAYDRELILFLYSKSSGMLTRWSNLKGESYSKVRRRRSQRFKA